MVLGMPHFKSNLRNTQLFASKIFLRNLSKSWELCFAGRGRLHQSRATQLPWPCHGFSNWCSLNSFNAKRRCKPSTVSIKGIQRAQKAHETFVGICWDMLRGRADRRSEQAAVTVCHYLSLSIFERHVCTILHLEWRWDEWSRCLTWEGYLAPLRFSSRRTTSVPSSRSDHLSVPTG